MKYEDAYALQQALEHPDDPIPFKMTAKGKSEATNGGLWWKFIMFLEKIFS